MRLGKSGNTVPLAVLPLILLLFLAALLIKGSVYQIEAEEEGVLLRLGQYSRTVPPGLHFKVPLIHDVVRVPVKRQMKQEYGFGTSSATNRYQSLDSREWHKQKNMVTGDLNAAEVEWTAQYRIDDPVKYLFNVRNPEETLRDLSESCMRQIVGDRTVDEVITSGRTAIEAEVLEKLRNILVDYDMGINVSLIQITDVRPPKEVEDSFNDVERAKQEKKESINLALAAKDKVVPEARGLALGKVSTAEGYLAQRVNEAHGDVAAFNALYEAYLKAPAVTKRRIYLETMAEVMPKLGKKVILDDQSGSVLPLLDLNGRLGGQGGAR